MASVTWRQRLESVRQDSSLSLATSAVSEKLDEVSDQDHTPHYIKNRQEAARANFGLGGSGEHECAEGDRDDVEDDDDDDDVSASAGRQFESDERVLALAYCRMVVEEKKDHLTGTLGRFACRIQRCAKRLFLGCVTRLRGRPRERVTQPRKNLLGNLCIAPT